MQMAGLTRTAVDLPLDADAFDRFIADMTVRYGGKKTLKTVEAGQRICRRRSAPVSAEDDDVA